MASLFQHLRVLLWKNWLSVKRQPLWSLTLIVWPAITFIMVAIIRIRFPPEAQPNCYLAPRNLPSVGFFPFLQTVLCSTDAKCKSTAYTPEDLLPKLNGISPISRKQKRSAHPEKDSNLSFQSVEAPKRMNGSLELIDSIANLKGSVENLPSSSHAGIHLLTKLQRLRKPKEGTPSVANLKAGICEVLAPYASPRSPLREALETRIFETFCFTNVSLMETFFQEFRSQISKLNNPQYQRTFVKETVSILSLVTQVQNEPSIWRFLLTASDLTEGVTTVKAMLAALQNSSRIMTDTENDSPLVMSDGLQTIQNMLHSLNCSEQDKNNSVMAAVCEVWKKNQTLSNQMKDVLRKILSPDLSGKNSKMDRLEKDLEAVKRFLHLFKDLQKNFSAPEMTNLDMVKLLKNKVIMGLPELLQGQIRGDKDNKLRDLLSKEEIEAVQNFTSLLLQNDSTTLALFKTMADLRETLSGYNLHGNVWDLTVLNETGLRASKAWQAIKMISSHKYSYRPLHIRRYLASMRQVSSLVANSLLTPTTTENFPEKILVLQKIYNTIANVGPSNNYLMIAFVTDLMQKIQNSILESQWNEFNIYWHIGEKLRAAKWNGTDLIAYRQVLDILHNSLEKQRNGSGLPLRKELEYLTAFVNHLLEENSGEGVDGANTSMVLDTILQTLHVLDDLAEKYVGESITIKPIRNVDNKTIQWLHEILKEGVDMLSDPSLTNASIVKKMDALFGFSHLLFLQNWYRTPLWHNISVEAKALELLYLASRPFLKEAIQGKQMLPNCSVKDVYHITTELLFNNVTLKEALTGGNCSFLIALMNFESRTSHNQTFMEWFELAIENLKSMPTFATLHRNGSNYFSDDFQCLIKTLQLSSGVLSKLNSFQNYKNPWIHKMHATLTAVADKFLQNNVSCQVSMFGSGVVINNSSALNSWIPFMLNETQVNSQNLSGSPSVWEEVVLSSILLHGEPRRSALVSEMLEVSKWKNFSKVFTNVANILNTNQNVTNLTQYARLLEMTRKALILVGTGLAPNKTETQLFLQTLSWGLKFSDLEDTLGSLNAFFNETSETDNKPYLERLFHRLSPPIDVLAQSIFYANPHWEKIEKALHFTLLIWNQLHLNKTHFNFATVWETIEKVMTVVHPLFPEGLGHDLKATQFSQLKFATNGSFLDQLLAMRNVYEATASVSKSQNYPSVAQLSRTIQRIQILANKSWWKKLSAFGRIGEQLKLIKPQTYREFLNELRNQLTTQDNSSALRFRQALEKLARLLSFVLHMYGEGESHNTNFSEDLNTVLWNLFSSKDVEPEINISQLEKPPVLTNGSNKTLQKLSDILRQGAIIISDSRLENATEKERVVSLYGFSRFLFPKEFEEILGRHKTSVVETKIVEMLHLSLRPFLGVRNSQNCSAPDVIHIMLEMLFQNTTLRETLKQSRCEPLFTSRDLEKRTMSNQTLSELFEFSIRNIALTPELASLYKNNSDFFPGALLCIIKSLQFTSGLLSKMAVLFHFKYPWIQESYKTLSTIWKEAPPNNSTCPIPGLEEGSNAIHSDPLSIMSPVFSNENVFYSQDATGNVKDRNDLSMLVRRLWEIDHQSSPTKENIQKVQDGSGYSGWNDFVQLWNLVSETEAGLPKPGLKLAKRALSHESTPELLDIKAYLLKEVIMKDLKADLVTFFLTTGTSRNASSDQIAHLFTKTAETLLHKTLFGNVTEEEAPKNHFIAQSLFSGFENIFLQILPNNGFGSYLSCLMNVTKGLHSELPENVPLPPIMVQLKSVLLAEDEGYKKYLSVPQILMLRLSRLRNTTLLLCDKATVRWVQQTCHLPDISLAELCEQSEFQQKLLHGVEVSERVANSLINQRSMVEELREILIGDPTQLQQRMNWFQENMPQLSYLRDIPQSSIMNLTKNAAHPHKQDTLIDLFRNVDRLQADLRDVAGMSRESVEMLLKMPLPENRTQLISQLLHFESCGPDVADAQLDILAKEFCSLSLTERARKSYIFGITLLHYLDVYNFMYKMLLPKELQIPLDRILDLLKELNHFKDQISSDIHPLLGAIRSLAMLRQSRNGAISKALDTNLTLGKGTFKTISKVLCNQDIKPLFFESLLPDFEQQNVHHSAVQDDRVQHILKKYGIPQDSSIISPVYSMPIEKGRSSNLPQTDVGKIDMSEKKIPSKSSSSVSYCGSGFKTPPPNLQSPKTWDAGIRKAPFCLSFYLDLVKTPTGALIWSFLKPMLLGEILYTPDTPETQAIMEKSNSTMELLANLTQKSKEWLDNSPSIMNSLTMLKQTVPVVKNTLRNPFVQVFIKLMVKLDAVELLNQIDELDLIRLELQNNADILNKLNILSELSVNISSCVLFDRIHPAKTEEELETMAKDLFLKNELFGSVIFKLPSESRRENRTNPGVLSLPPLVNYTIRMSSKISQTTKRIREKIWTVGPHNSASQSQIYSRAFVYLQDSIDRAIIELQTGRSAEDIGVQVQAMPYPCYSKDMFLTSVTYSLPFTLMAAWVLFIAAFVKKLVQEKDLRLYEYMKMMGVNSSSHFFAWFIECASFLLITITFLIIILKVGNILPHINVVILFLYLLDYSFSIIAMCYLISVFFNNTNIAALVGSLIYILTFFPFIVLLVVENHVSFSVKSLLSLLSPTAFSYASQYIARYEEQGIGLQWDNMYKSPMSGDNTNFGWMCWLILIDSFIYFILGWYIRNVFPGKYGMAAPWYFPLLPSYWAERYGYIPLWNGKRKGLLFTNFFLRQETKFPEKMYVQGALPSHIEPEPANQTVGVSLHGITKIYGSKAGVQNLNLNFYEGNITSLLGHNGAGKTTTISILTGLFPASSGTIFVYGKDIRTDQDIIRKDMGICMQHNVLFSYLTTKEHLLLYGYIKVPHWSKQELREEIHRTLKETGLFNHRHKLAGSLSGGMKRKLSISIALLGGSRVVILDEPTTGVDPCSRRGIWEIISKNRKGRTIILSTHHLDEAEVLSDRIAFLEHGGLKCCGSPFYLKETFGSGYHLTLTKKKSPTLNLSEECDTSKVTALIQSHLPEAFLKEDIGGELIYVLPPFNSRVSSAYESLLRSLDNSLSVLQLGCYGISDSTVEEVFLNLTKDLAKDEQGLSEDVPSCILETDQMSTNCDSFTERDDKALVRLKKPNNICSLLKKSSALLVKRFHHTRRNVKGFIAQVILPVLFVTTAMGLGTLRTEVAEYPALQLSPSLYGSSKLAEFFGNYNDSTEPLVAAMLSFPGADNTCLNESNLGCFEEIVPAKWTFSGNQSSQYSPCNCTSENQPCPKVDFSPPHKRTFSSRTVYNLTGHDIETYLLVTAKDFVQKRYGGWSFGLPLTSDLRFDINPVPANRTITKVWYNPEGYHSLPAYLNSLNNFILRANLPKENSSRYGISVVAHPYPGGESQEQLMLCSLLDIIVAMSVLIGYSITTASFVLYVVKEHQTKAKQLQHISGIGVRSYWVTNFIYDLVYFMVPVVLSVGVISAFQIPAFFNDNNLLAVFLLLLLFGYATFSWMYLLAGIFKETGMAFIVYVCINLFFGINTIITHSVVFLLSQEKATDQGLHDLAEMLRHVFLIFPQFCFGYGLIELSQQQALVGFLKAYGVTYPDRTFELDRMSSKLLGMAIQGTIFISIRLVVDDGTIQKIWYNILEFLFDKIHGKPTLQLDSLDEEEDKDVQAEQDRVASGLADYDMLQLQNLTKIYHLPHKRIVAVKNVSIGIPAGECFGLLGVNGAGKTTIFKMLTGDIGPSNGRLLVRDEMGSLNDIDDAHWSLFGYCPQEDALDDLLTVEEHMYYYARLHGIPEKHIKGIVLQLLYRLNLMPYRQRITSMCSYGTNRKLSTALALLGKPSILLLDEPSSGMDPNAKRHLWKIITEEVQNQCSVILTSHSMEECEALCTRLAIMVNGRFQCLGSLQHIKSRFGKGFTVKMHLKNDSACIEKLTQFMQSNFPNTCLKDHQLNMVEYHVSVAAGGVATIFKLLEANKTAFQIRHFSVSQTTLEEVFINFAKDQAGPDILDTSSDVGSDGSDSCSQVSNISAID